MSRMSGSPTFEAHSSYISPCSRRQSRTSPIWGESRANRREPNWGEFADQVIPGLPLSQTSDGNYVASELVPCVFLAAPHPQRHITPSATEVLCGGPHKISQIHSNPSGSFDTDRHSIGSTNDASLLGNESNRARISFCILFLRKTDAT